MSFPSALLGSCSSQVGMRRRGKECSQQDCPWRVVCSLSASRCYFSNSFPNESGVQMPAFLLWTHHCFLEPPLCTLNPEGVSFSPFLLGILTHFCQGQSCCWGITVWRSFLESSSRCFKAQPPSVLSSWRLLCSPADSRRVPCTMQEGNAGSSHLGALSQHQLPLFSLPQPQGHQELVWVNGSVTFRQILSWWSGERDSLLPFELVEEGTGEHVEWSPSSSAGDGWLPSIMSNVHPWIDELIKKISTLRSVGSG